MFLSDSRGQGAIEYLIIIGGAILIAAVVLAILLSTTEKAQDKADNTFDDFNRVATVNIPTTGTN